jgi:hypothetical protein
MGIYTYYGSFIFFIILLIFTWTPMCIDNFFDFVLASEIQAANFCHCMYPYRVLNSVRKYFRNYNTV